MEFSPTLLAIVPPLLAILLAVITRQVVLSLFIAVFVGAVMLCGGNLWCWWAPSAAALPIR